VVERPGLEHIVEESLVLVSLCWSATGRLDARQDAQARENEFATFKMTQSCSKHNVGVQSGLGLKGLLQAIVAYSPGRPPHDQPMFRIEQSFLTQRKRGMLSHGRPLR
jgi:hypothetical protein